MNKVKCRLKLFYRFQTIPMALFGKIINIVFNYFSLLMSLHYQYDSREKIFFSKIILIKKKIKKNSPRYCFIDKSIIYLFYFSLLDPQTESEIISYRIPQILFCARGASNTPLAFCWAFTTSRLSTSTASQRLNQSQTNGNNIEQELLYQCQVFRCDMQESVELNH